MTTFKHKELNIEISYSEYVKLSTEEKSNFIIINPPMTTNNVTNVNVNNETKDVLGLGEVAAVTVGLPLVMIGGFLGMFDK